jgi:hypothetical protein
VTQHTTAAGVTATRRTFVSFVAFVSVSLIVSAAGAQTKTRAHVAALASEKTEGRLTGSAGERVAGDYLVGELKRIGAKPLPGAEDFRLPFEFTAGSKDGGTRIALTNGTTAGAAFGGHPHVQALSFSDNTDVTGPVVFAGYGIVVPSGQTTPALAQGYDSYAGLDVAEKVVVVLRYFPEDADTATKQLLARYADLRYKAMAARQRGAKALLVVTGPRSPNAGEIIPMSFDTALAGSGIAAASISGDVAKEIFATAGQTLDKAQEALDSANPHATGFAIPDISVTLHTSVVREKQTGYNVAAYLPATGDASVVARPWIALGAHYDHLGRGNHGNSLAQKDEASQIHFGADDNASGSAAVLGIAEILSRLPRRRHVLLAFWSGEELGLVGSAAFVNTAPVPASQLAAYLNFDMVGRMEDNRLSVQAMGTSPVWAKLIEQANVSAGFDLQLQQDPYQPTDVATFNQADVPSLNFFTGTHTDYHRPSDTADKIEYEDLDRIVEFSAAIVRRLDGLPDAPQFTKVEQMQTGGRAGLRVFTGTIPDYATEVNGLLLGGVIGGGPAELAGLRKGDVIVEIANQTIANIYDYTYALEVLKIGVPVKIAYMRDGKRIETTLTPGARK